MTNLHTPTPQQTEENLEERLRSQLASLNDHSNLRQLPSILHEERDIIVNGQRMLNLSSNDYLGLASDIELHREFLDTLTPEAFLPSSSSSRLLTGNFTVYDRLEQQLAEAFDTEAALVFNSGYHANTGILPAICDARTLILADKLVHASLIDGIRLSGAKCIRFRHNEYCQLERLVEEQHSNWNSIIIVTESIFSMDGDAADLEELVHLKKRFPNVYLYVDEAHAFGIRGDNGLGCAEEQGCITDIDFLVGTFGKSLASAGAYIVCKQVIRDYLINKMRTFIFTTALPPVNIQWTSFLLQRLPDFRSKRDTLKQTSQLLREALKQKRYDCPSVSHIVPMVTGTSSASLLKAEELQRKGFYVLPVRPPTVPEGTSRIRFSLTAAIRMEEISALINQL